MLDSIDFKSIAWTDLQKFEKVALFYVDITSNII